MKQTFPALNRKIGFPVALAAVLLLVALVFPYFVRIDRFRPLIEQRCSQISPVAIHLDGHLSFGLLPSPHLTLEKVRVDNPPAFGSTPLLSLQRLEVRVAFWPLLHRHLRVVAVQIDGPHLNIIKNKEGKINLVLSKGGANPNSGASPRNGLEMTNIRVHDLSAAYRDEKSGGTLLLQDGALQVEDVVLSSGADSPERMLADRLSLHGTLSCKKISIGDKEFANVLLHFAYHGGKGKIELERAGWAGCQLQGKASLDLRARPETITAECTLLPSKQKGGRTAFGLGGQGSVTLQADLKVNPGEGRKLLTALTGKVRIQGKDLLLNGYDLDTVIDQYRKSSDVSLVDIGALLVAGPLAALVSKGIDVAGFRHGFGDVRTEIVRLGARIGLAKGIAEAEDVAFTTDKNRVAIKGEIDMLRQRYLQLQVAVVDPEGCAEVQQTINGPLDNPDLGTEQFGLHTLSRPFTSLLKKAEDFLGQNSCEPFYTGEIPAPQR